MLSGASAILIASAELSLVQSLRAAIAPRIPYDGYGGKVAGGYSVSDNFIASGAVTRPLIAGTYARTQAVLAPNPTDLAAPPANLASDPLPAPDPGAIPIHDKGTHRKSLTTPVLRYDVTPETGVAGKPQTPVKVVLLYTDTRNKGAMIDFFC